VNYAAGQTTLLSSFAVRSNNGNFDFPGFRIDQRVWSKSSSAIIQQAFQWRRCERSEGKSWLKSSSDEPTCYVGAASREMIGLLSLSRQLGLEGYARAPIRI